MEGLEKHLEKEKKKPKLEDEKQNKGIRGDIDDEDDEESYYRLDETNMSCFFFSFGCDYLSRSLSSENIQLNYNCL